MTPQSPRARPRGSARAPLRSVNGVKSVNDVNRNGVNGDNAAVHGGRAAPIRDGRRKAGPGRVQGTGRMQKGESPKVRGERTRARIADAVIDLLIESEALPTAKEVATRAQVSVRLVFHHFEDMQALYRDVARIQIQRHWQTVRPVSGDLPVSTRIERTVQQRGKLFDSIAPVRRKAVMLALLQPDVAEGLQQTYAMLRAWLEETFDHELQSAGTARRELLGALDAAASFEFWEHLRQVQGLPSATSRRIVTRTLRTLLGV